MFALVAVRRAEARRDQPCAIPPDKIARARTPMNSRRPHRGLPRNDERRARRRRQHARRPIAATWRTPPMPSTATWRVHRHDGPSILSRATSPRAASPPPRRRESSRRCGSSSSFSTPKAYAPTTRPARSTAPRKDRPLPKTMSEAETGRLLDRAALEAADPAQGSGDLPRRCACMRWSRCSTPPACAFRNWSACR